MVINIEKRAKAVGRENINIKLPTGPAFTFLDPKKKRKKKK